MPWLRRYAPHFGHQARFRLAVVLTIAAVCWVALPPMTRFVETISGYNPAHYEPKDFERQQWLLRQDPDALLAQLTPTVLFNIVLFALVAGVWLTVIPTRSPRRRTPPHR